MLSATELRDEGYLQEVNRLFFHRLGLALAVDIERNEQAQERGHTGCDELIVQVWDGRDDPEGFCFGDLDESDAKKALHVHSERRKRMPARLRMFNDICALTGIEPLGWRDPDVDSTLTGGVTR